MKKSAHVVPHASNLLVVGHTTSFLCLLYKTRPFLTAQSLLPIPDHLAAPRLSRSCPLGLNRFRFRGRQLDTCCFF